MRMLRTGMTAMATTALLFGATMAPAEAAPQQDGLVNVNVSGNEILNDVNIAVAVEAVANLCDTVDVGPVAAGILGQAVATDASGRESRTVCTAEGAPVTFTQN